MKKKRIFGLSKRNETRLFQIVVSLILMITSFFFVEYSMFFAGDVTFAICFVAYMIVGHKILLRALRNIFHGKVFDENFLMTLATIGAFAIGEYVEGLAVMIFYQVGEFFQSLATEKSRNSIAELMDICPEYANLMVGETFKKVDPETVKIGDVVVVKAGEKIPLDGKVIFGESTLDQKALTGESLPISISVGDNVLSGSINLSSNLQIKVTSLYENSTVAKILELVENASMRKSKSEKFISKFAKYYTPLVVIAAFIIALIPSLIWKNPDVWVYNALTFLVVSCPCALVISIPMSFFGGLGSASNCGVLIKGANYIETLAKIETVVFDKTGTLTKGTFEILEVTNDETLQMAGLAQCYSNHPIGISILKKAKNIDIKHVKSLYEHQGMGVEAETDYGNILCGNEKLMDKFSVEIPFLEREHTIIYVAKNYSYIGHLIIGDTVKDDSNVAIEKLEKLGVNNIFMLSGDSQSVVDKVGENLGISYSYGELLPSQKVEMLEEILTNSDGKVAFCGDGINDAPSLSRSDVGISMGGLGSDAAIEASDVVIMTDQPSKIGTAIEISRYTMKIVKQNIIFALGIKAIVMVLGIFSLSNLWLAILADVGVSIVAILNASRTLYKFRGK